MRYEYVQNSIPIIYVYQNGICNVYMAYYVCLLHAHIYIYIYNGNAYCSNTPIIMGRVTFRETR